MTLGSAPNVAPITSVTGQDGAYLAELLLDNGYEVHDIKRSASLFNTDRIDHLYQYPHVGHQRFALHYGDLTDSTNLIRAARRDLQPGRAMACGRQFRRARVHRQCRRLVALRLTRASLSRKEAEFEQLRHTITSLKDELANATARHSQPSGFEAYAHNE